MPLFLFNVQTTIEVEAPNEETALDCLDAGGGRLLDRDVLLADVKDDQ